MSKGQTNDMFKQMEELFSKVDKLTKEVKSQNKEIKNLKDELKVNDKVVLLRIDDKFIILSKVVSI